MFLKTDILGRLLFLVDFKPVKTSEVIPFADDTNAAELRQAHILIIKDS